MSLSHFTMPTKGCSVAACARRSSPLVPYVLLLTATLLPHLAAASSDATDDRLPNVEFVNFYPLGGLVALFVMGDTYVTCTGFDFVKTYVMLTTIAVVAFHILDLVTDWGFLNFFEALIAAGHTPKAVTYHAPTVM